VRAASLSTPEHREVGRLLLEKANEDLSAAKALIAEDQADHVIGFHFQQTAEKALKAVLAENAVEIPRTHDLGYLVEQLVNLKLDIPPAVASCDWLTPWGVLFRYDADPDTLDRDKGLEAATAAIDLAERVVTD
jgi:HEPN domain-containing protein